MTKQRDPYGRLTKYPHPTYRGYLPSVDFDWDAALLKLEESLGVKLASVERFHR